MILNYNVGNWNFVAAGSKVAIGTMMATRMLEMLFSNLNKDMWTWCILNSKDSCLGSKNKNHVPQIFPNNENIKEMPNLLRDHKVFAGSYKKKIWKSWPQIYTCTTFIVHVL